MLRSAYIEVDLDALLHNVQRVKDFAPHSKIMAVIKANAYGHGAARVAASLKNHVAAFAVSCINEARELQKTLDASFAQSIIILQGVHNMSDLKECADNNWAPVIHHQAQIEQLIQAEIAAANLNLWLKLDSGMGRLGLSSKEFSAAIIQLQGLPAVKTLSLMSHFSCADDLESNHTTAQLHRFTELSDAKFQRSLANSAGICAWPASHLDWLRPGLMLYGASPMQRDSAGDLKLKAVMSLFSTVISIKTIKAGDSAGYGASWVAGVDTHIAICAIGYGDGYPRHKKGSSYAWAKGRRREILGRISMDMIAIAAHDDIQMGDRVEFWGKHIAIDDVAHNADTIAYELMCSVSKQVDIRYASSHCDSAAS